MNTIALRIRKPGFWPHAGRKPLWVLAGALAATIGLTSLAGCRTPKSESSSVILPAGLPGAAWSMYNTFIQENRLAGGRSEAQIPTNYWTAPIVDLRPVRIYLHRVNMVIVQHERQGAESGKYIYIPWSSYMPQDGDDGFTFTPLTESVYDYHRSRSSEVQ